jgi:hypothetical protein
MSKTMLAIGPDESRALIGLMSGESTTTLAASAARKMLTNIAIRSEDLQLEPADVLEAFADAYKPMSANGMYYKLQHFLCSYIGAIGATAVTGFGIAATLYYITKGANVLLHKAVSTFASLVAPTGALAVAGPGGYTLAQVAKAAWKRLFGATANDATLDADGDQINPSVLALGLSTMLPAPISFMVNEFAKVLESNAPINVPTTVRPAPAPAAPPATAPAPQTSTVSSLSPFVLGAVSPVAALGSTIGNLLGKGLASIGLADEVRDEVRDEVAKAMLDAGEAALLAHVQQDEGAPIS